jgi:hypothetical protein
MTTIDIALYVCLIIHSEEILSVQKNIFFPLSNASYQTMSGMRSSTHCPRKSHVIPKDIQLSRLERCLMVFCLYSGLAASGRCCQRNMALVLPAIDDFNNGSGWEYSRNYGLSC